MKILLKLVLWLIGFIVAVVVIDFAVSNRASVTVDLWPLPAETALPVFVLPLVGLVFGVILGGVVAWLSAGHTRSALRKGRRIIAKLEREVADLRHANPPTAETPRLPPPHG